MKLKQLLSLALASALAVGAQAQTVDQVGYGQMVSVQYGPFRTSSAPENTGRIIAYKEAELNGIGIHPGAVLHSLKWYKATADSILGSAEARMILYTRNTHFTLPAAGYSSGIPVPAYTDTAFVPVDTVIYNAANNLGDEGWIGFSGFNYEYKGQDLEVYVRFEILNDNQGPEFSEQLTWRYDSTSVRYYAKNDYGYTGNFGPLFFRPNTQIGFDAATCASTLYGGTTVADFATNVCPGTNIEISLQNESYVPGTTTYVWETAPSASGPWSTYSMPVPQGIIGLTAPSATTWYRAHQTCGSDTAYSTPLEVQVNPGLTGTFTINSALPTNGANYQSYSDAVAALNCGVSGSVTFNVAPGSGPYVEKVIINEVQGASAINTITFNGNGTTLKQPDDTTGSMATIKLNGADYVTFNGLTIKTVPNLSSYQYMYGHSVQMTNDADYNVIKNCNIEVRPIDWYIDTAKYGAIVINGGVLPTDGANSNCDHNTIMNNTIKGGYYAIAVAGDNSNPSQGNVISGNTLADFVEYGVYVANTAGTQVDSNNISRPTTVNPGDFYGIHLTAQSGAMVSANKVHDPSVTNTNSGVNATAISLTNSMTADSNRNVIANNVVYNMNSLGANAGIALSGVQGVNIYHNTLSLESANTFCGGCMGAYGIYQYQSPAANVSVMNNIITVGGTGDAAQQPLHFDDTLSSAAFNNNNYFFSNGTSAATSITSMGGVQYASLADWQAATSAEQNSVSLDPQYVDVANGNLEPGNTSLDNLGQPLNISTDIRSIVRSTISPDMGAYEYGTIPMPLSVHQVAASEIAVYPNPATERINITSPEKLRAILLSIDGRKMVDQENAASVDIRALSEGTYILQLINKDGIIIKTEKIVKIR